MGIMAVETPTVIENKTEVFEKWASHYATMNAKVIDSHGIGLASKGAAKSGEVLVSVPESLILSEQTIDDMSMSDMKMSKWLSLQPVTDRHRLHRALVYLALMDPPAKWLVYFKLLPTNGDINLPFSWTDDNLDQLKGTSIFEPTSSKKSIVEVQYYEFCQLAKPMLDGKEIPFSLWVLAYQWISSRSLTNPKDKQSILVPIIDLCNHGSEPNVRYDLDGSSIVLVSTRDLAPDQELVLDYGSRSSGEFLFNYGFIPEKTHTDELLRLYDPENEEIRKLLDPSRDPDCPAELKREMEMAYNLLMQFMPEPMQVLRLSEDGTWSDEFVTLVACEDLVELKSVDGQYSLYIRDEEIQVGQIHRQTAKFSEVAYRGKNLAALLAEHFAETLNDEGIAVNNPEAETLRKRETELYTKFIDAAREE